MGYHQKLVRTILHFSLRIDARDAPQDVLARVEEALGARFHEREYHGLSLREVYLMGMAIRFLPWRSIGLKEVFQLTGYTEVPDDYQSEEKLTAIDLNQAMIDLLEAKGAGTWHVPSLDEIQAEASTAASLAAEDEDDDSGPPDDWPPEQ